jgi:predicted nucleic acid-binding protein
VAIKAQYARPYFDAAVFISWLKDTDIGPLTLGGPHGDRHPVSERVVLQAEHGAYSMVTSYLTMAEVFKKKGDGNPPLTDQQNGKIVKYFENEWIEWVPVERLIGEDANALLVRYRKEKLRPNDAIHLACALRAKCDVLLTWDGPLCDVKHPEIRIEYPEILVPITLPEQTRLFESGQLTHAAWTSSAKMTE